MIPRQRQFGSKQPSRAYQTVALGMALMQRENLDTINAESWATMHGKTVAAIKCAIADERERRAGA